MLQQRWQQQEQRCLNRILQQHVLPAWQQVSQGQQLDSAVLFASSSLVCPCRCLKVRHC
jgi:hypothetical protein